MAARHHLNDLDATGSAPFAVEAPTIAEAVDLIAERWGAEARIVRTERITSRVIGSRDATERVRVTAASSTAEIDLRDPPTGEVTGMSRARLLQVGLTAGVVDTIMASAPTDRASLERALATAIGPYWFSPPHVDAQLMGAGAGPLAALLGIAWPTEAASAGPVHLVVDPQRGRLAVPPLGTVWVSASTPDALVTALQLCFLHRLRLGYVAVDGFARLARPELVASLVADRI